MVTREQLYEEVWKQPMIVVAARYEVSANYLARVCECLNVPHPPRGYWAKLQAGKRVKKPALPPARPGDETEWSKGTSPGLYSSRRRVENAGAALVHTPADRAAKHPLLVGVQEYYDAARLSEEGYLRPLKRNLVDIFVSRQALTYAINSANDLFLILEKRGYRVALASAPEHSHRPKLSLYEGQKFDYYNREPWVPGRETLVFVGHVAFGLTLYELTEQVDVTYQWNSPVRYVRTSDMLQKRKPAWASETTYKRHMPCGRLALRAYCPYGRVSWQRQWQEASAGQLSKKFKTIARELQAAVPEIVSLREEAERRAEADRQRWEAECRERERQERARRRAAALKESRQHLFEVVEAWGIAKRLEAFFEDAERRANQLEPEQGAEMLARLERGRNLLGGVDALRHFESWKTPEQRDAACFSDDA